MTGTTGPLDATAWDRRYADPAGVWGAAPNVWVVQELGALAPGRAMDLAAGEGRHALWLADRGWKVKAVDFSSTGLEVGRNVATAQALGENIEWIVQDATAITPEPGSADLVLVAYLQLPATQLQAAVTVAARALAPGGRFLFVSHDASNLEHGTGGPQDPAVLQTPAQVAGWLRAAGMSILSAETRTRAVAGKLRPALDCVVVAQASPGDNERNRA